MCNQASAQSRPQTKPDTERLQEIARRFKQNIVLSDRVWTPAGKRARNIDSTGTETQLLGLVQNRPLAYTTHNRRAAATIRATSLWEGGRSGLSVEGAEQITAVWDAGNVRITHRELAGRAAQKDTTTEGVSHATHVAATVAAAGKWDVATGIAPKAFVDSYNWVDDVAEMAIAASEGLTLSNHSYGIPLGWTPNFHGDGIWTWMGDVSVSRSTDYRFGFYDFLAQRWDEISQAAPGYLIVKSAGNEREQSGPKNGQPHYVYENGWEIQTTVRSPDAGLDGYDTIGDAGVAKNVLTVGATESAPWGVESPQDVVMTSFSSWGPTDDGRIKPDLVAPGVMLMSAKAASDEDYGPSSGTSMAAPVVTGAATLIQELYKKEFPASPPLSSTIKGLLIHTADEAGPSDGPDYQFGWGQVNAERAALHLHQAGISSRSLAPKPPFESQVLEGVLLPGESREWTVFLDEKKTFRATLAWIDPAAESGDKSLNNPESKLVHDLNLAVEGVDGAHLPWVLNPASPSEAASRGVNVRDNVEQVVFLAESGQYTIQVTAPSQLQTASQSFSLIIGEAVDVFEPTAASALSGNVSFGGAGIQDVVVHLQGPVWVNFNTLKDGVFYFQNLPPGTYDLFPENPHLTFSPASVQITLPRDAERFHFEAIPPLAFTHAEWFETPQLLGTGEIETAKPVTTLAAGGVYGLTLGFESGQAQDLSGLKVLLDTDFDPRLFPFSGATGTHIRELSDDWTLSAYDATRLSKRVPALWVDGNAQTPFVARLPYSVRLASDQIIYADTLELTVDRPDDQAPIPFTSIRLPGLAYAPPGSPLEVRIGTLDGSRVKEITALFLDRDNETTILNTIPLRDTGDVENDFDLVAADGMFSAKFIPRIEADYRLAVRTVDVHGNENVTITDSYYSSRPFRTEPDILFWTTYEKGSATKAHQAVFDEIGFDYAWWDELTRGQLKAADMAQFDLVILSRQSAPIRTEADMTLIADFVREGGKMVILGENPIGDKSREWMQTEFGLTLSSSSETTTRIDGLAGLQGFTGTMAQGARPAHIVGPSNAVPILVQNGRAVAIQSGNLLLSTVSAPSIDSPIGRIELLSRLLFAASQNASTVKPLVPPVFDQPTGYQMTKDGHILSWDPQPFASYNLEISTSSGFNQGSTTTFSSNNPFVDVAGLSRGKHFFARVNAVNPAHESAWSMVIEFDSRPANQPPLALVAGQVITFASFQPTPFVIEGLSTLFNDPEGDALTIEATSSTAGVVDLVFEGNALHIKPLRRGETTVFLKAIDSEGSSATITYPVQYNSLPTNHQPPVYVGNFPFVSEMILGDTLERDFSNAFTDANNDVLMFEVIQGEPKLFQVDFAAGVLRLTPTVTGTTFYVVWARDGNGGEASFHEEVHISSNQAPMLRFEPAITSLLSHSDWNIDLHALFEDPEEESLTFSGLGQPESAYTLKNDSLFASFSEPGFYSYSLTATDPRGATTAVELRFAVNGQAVLFAVSDQLPTVFSIESVFPHPFSSRTTFEVHIPDPGPFKLEIHDLQGRLVATVADRRLGAGVYHLDWSPRDLPAGVYVYRASWFTSQQTGLLVKTN